MAAKWTPAQLNWFSAIQKRNAGDVSKGGMLSPLQNAQYQTGIADTNLDYGQQLAQNAYSRGQAAAGYGQQRGDLLQQYHDMRQQMPYGANAHGILGSGIYHQQLQDAARTQSQNLGALNVQRSGALGQFDLLRQQLEQKRAGNLANLRTQRAGALQQTKLGLQGL